MARRASSGWQMPLTQQRQVGQRAQPGQVVPGRAGCRRAGAQCSDGGLRVLLRRLAEPGAEDRVAGVVGQAVPAQLGEVGGGQVARAPAGDPGVERDDDALEAGRLGAVHQAGGQVAVGRRVQLEEARGVAELGGDVLHRVGGQRRGDHRDAGAGGRAGGGQVAVAVLRAQADHADRRHEQRATAASCRTARRTGRARRRRRTSAASGPSWSNALDVGPLGVLVARAAGDVGPAPTAAAPARPWPRARRTPSAATGRTPRRPCEVDLELVVPEGGHLDIKAHGELQPFCTSQGTRAATRPGTPGRADRTARPGVTAHQAPADGGGITGGTIASIRCGPGSA